MPEQTIASRYAADATAREPILDIVRLCARVTIPSILPPLEMAKNPNTGELLPQNYQDTGASGIESLAGQMLLGLFPPDVPFITMMPSAEVLHDQSIPDAVKQAIIAALQVREILFMAALESGVVQTKGRRYRRTNFRSSKRSTLEALLATGDTLERMTDDFRFNRFRRDKYVTKRDSCGNVLYHIVIENFDALSIDNAETNLQKAGLNYSEFADKPVSERMVDLYTDVQWQPQSKVWLTRQELNGKVINESQDEVSAWISTPYELPDGEDYGRGFIERRLGSLRSLDTLHEKLLDWAALASYMLTCVDNASEFREKDLTKPSGSVSRGARVSGGMVQDVAFLALGEKLRDFMIVDKAIDRLERRLNRSMLNEIDMQPHKDRVTATQIDSIREAVMGATSGVYATISDDQQLPMVDRGMWLLAKQGKFKPLPEGTVEVRTLTGISALGRQAKARDIESLFAEVGQIAPDLIERFDKNVLLEVLARYKNINEPGLILTREQWAEKQRADARQQIALAAAGKAIDTGGNVIENAAAAQATPASA